MNAESQEFNTLGDFTTAELMEFIRVEAGVLSDSIREAQRRGINVSLTKVPAEKGEVLQIIYVVNPNPRLTSC